MLRFDRQIVHRGHFLNMRSIACKAVLSASCLPSQKPAFCRASTVVRCQQEGSTQESSSFRNNLRKGFAPVKRENIKPQSAGPNLGKNLVLGGDDFSIEKWREVDKKMNKYPGKRTFSAIGSGGEEFTASMIKAVESVTGPVHPEGVSGRPSSGGAYISVRIDVTVQTPDQVVEIFANMKADPRLKWLM